MRHFLTLLAFELSLALAVILYTVDSAGLSLEWLKYAAILPFGCAAVIKVFFWRCPHCGTYFGKNFPGSYCRYCKNPLNDNDPGCQAIRDLSVCQKSPDSEP